MHIKARHRKSVAGLMNIVEFFSGERSLTQFN